ncbi:MAG: hypothetical protein HY319_13630 [Armatimonadetes bacterium]|nr:hypothetical protein [Armatimonadota bacterium]
MSGLAGGLLGDKFPGYGNDEEHPGYGVGITDVNYANFTGYLGGGAASIAYPVPNVGYDASAFGGYAQNGFQYGGIQAAGAVGANYMYGGGVPSGQYGAYSAGFQAQAQAQGQIYLPGYPYPSPYTGGFYGGGHFASGSPSNYFGSQPTQGYGGVLHQHATGYVHPHPYPGHGFGFPHPPHPGYPPGHPHHHPELKTFQELPQEINDPTELARAFEAVKDRLTGSGAGQKIIAFGGKNPNLRDGFTDTRLAVWKVLQANPHLRYNVDTGNFFVTEQGGDLRNVLHVDDAMATLHATSAYPELGRHLLRHQVDWAVDHHGVSRDATDRPNAATYVAPIAPTTDSGAYGFG